MFIVSILMKFGNGLLVLPLILVYYDINNQTLWLILSVINGSILIADSGFSPSLIRSVSYFYSGLSDIDSLSSDEIIKNENKINYIDLSKTISTFNCLYVLIGVVGALFVLPLGYFMTYGISDLIDSNIINICILLLSLKFYFSITAIKYLAILQGIDKLAYQKRIESIMESIRIIFLLFTIIFSSSIVYFFIADLIVSVITFLVYKVILNKELNKLKEGFSPGFKFSKKIFKFLWPPTWKFGLMQYGSFLSNHGNALVLTQIPNPLFISSFILTQKILNIVRQLSQSHFNAYLPNVYSLFAYKNFIDLKILVTKKIFKCLTWFSFISFFLIIFGQYCLDVINITTPLLDKEFILILCICYVLEMHHSIHAQIYISSNKVPFLLPALYSGLTIFFTSSFIIESSGVLGILLVQFFVQLSVNNWYPVYKSLGLLNWSFKDYLISFKKIKWYEGIL